jgi:5'-deoxynucleotidase YfbR-like HD superfamily hydrolase
MTQATAEHVDLERKGDWIQTFTGLVYYPTDPRPEDIDIIDVAHALSNQCRFTGHVKTFYSVAEHSCRASDIVPDKYKLEALLHDGTEAYCTDVAKPLKRSDEMKGYRDIEERNWLCFAAKYGLPEKMSQEVKKADEIMLFTEKRDLMSVARREWDYFVAALPDRIFPWTPEQSRENFLRRFVKLYAWNSEEERAEFRKKLEQRRIWNVF